MTNVEAKQGTASSDTWDKLMAKLDEITEKLRRAREDAESFLKQASQEAEKEQSIAENPSQKG